MNQKDYITKLLLFGHISKKNLIKLFHEITLLHDVAFLLMIQV